MILSKARSKAMFGMAIVRESDIGVIKDVNDVTNFNVRNWLSYWGDKAKKYGIQKFTPTIKDKSVIKSLQKNYTNKEIKTIIDYLWDSSYTFHVHGRELLKQEYGIYLLSSGWLGGYVNLALEGIDVKQSSRGWKSDEEGDVSIGW